MGNYKLSEAAKIDLIRIHQYGLLQFGEDQADRYFDAFFEQFKKIAENPYQFQKVDFIRKDYRRCVFGVDTIYFRITDKSVEIIRIIGRLSFRL